MSLRSGIPIVVALLLAGGGRGAYADQPHKPAAPIINGTPLLGDTAVVALVTADSARRDIIECTGTLVSSHVVVAAGHCLNFDGLPAPAFVYFGNDPVAGGAYRKVKTWRTHPEYKPEYTADYRINNDIGVLILADAAPVEVVPYALAANAPSVGQTARFVGFGCREATGNCGPFGEKYQTMTSITALTGTDFDYGVATCNGDSGGPAFVMENGHEVLAGVTSTGDTACAAFGVDTRVDAFAPWLRLAVAGEDPETCTGADCPCAADGKCTVACARPGNDPDCPADCGADGTCDSECPERDPDCAAGLPDGMACAADADCASNVCEGTCRPLCNPAADMACNDRLSCEEQRFGAYACVTASGGCGCRVGGAGRGAGGALAAVGGLLALLGLALVRRRTARRARLW